MLLVVDDLITEGLESDNLTLQNLSANKFVQACDLPSLSIKGTLRMLQAHSIPENQIATTVTVRHGQDFTPECSVRPANAQGNSFFLEKVTTWQRKLGAVDSVLSTWADVQKKWAALESIFVGSADIRTQLPADSARFDTLNTNFQARPLRMGPFHI